MTTSPTDLLTAPLIEIEADGARSHVTLPGVLARLITAERAAFPRVRAHQAHGWHVFLVSLARIALDHANLATPPESETAWRDLLGRLTPEAPTAWDLVVDDHRLPAFLQPPLPPEASGDYAAGKRARCPDDVDLPLASRGHALKAGHDGAARAEDWLHALVAAQTLAPYSSPGQYRAARMADGYGSRIVLTAGTRVCPAHLFRRDLAAVGELVTPELFDRRGPGLVWLDPWGGTAEEMRGLNGLHPQFIEIARRMRLTHRDGRLTCLRAAAKSPRFLAAHRDSTVRGQLGDPWTPIDRKKNAALHPAAGGFDTDLTLKLLLDRQTYHPAPLQLTRPDERTAPRFYVVARTLLANPGWLAYSERTVEIPRPTRHTLSQIARDPDRGETLRNTLFEVTEVIRTALAPAAVNLSFPHKEDINWKEIQEAPEANDLVIAAREAYQQRVEPMLLDAIPRLMTEPNGRGPAHSALRRALVEAAKTSLDHAAYLQRLSGHKATFASSVAAARLNNRLYTFFKPAMRAAA